MLFRCTRPKQKLYVNPTLNRRLPRMNMDNKWFRIGKIKKCDLKIFDMNIRGRLACIPGNAKNTRRHPGDDGREEKTAFSGRQAISVPIAIL